MAGRTVLQELSGAQPPSASRGGGGSSEPPCSARCSLASLVGAGTETPPDHDTGGMLDVNHHISLLVAVHTGGAADFLGPGVDQLEGRLVTEHDFVPVVLHPAEVFFCKRQSAS